MLLRLALSDEVDSVKGLNQEITLLMHQLKKQAEALDTRALTTEASQHQVALLCVSVQNIQNLFEMAALQIKQFIENSLKKWGDYQRLNNEVRGFTHLLTHPPQPQSTIKNEEGLTTTTTTSLPRMPKLDRHSNFNVIKISGQEIELTCTNRALITPSPATTLKAKGVTEVAIIYDPLIMFQLQEMGDNIVSNYNGEKMKMTVYRNHYACLGNLDMIEQRRAPLEQELNKIVKLLDLSSRVVAELVMRFDRMVGVLKYEIANSQNYILNTVNRFIEYSTTYEEALELARKHQLSLTIHSDEEKTNAQREVVCSGMY